MEHDRTTVAVQEYLDALAGDAPADPIVRALLNRAVGRLQILCGGVLGRSYPRLMRPPLNLQTDELLGGVVERLLRAMRAARPKTVRQFFALANRHIRWELNDFARRLDKRPHSVELSDDAAAAQPEAESAETPRFVRMLDAIEQLPQEEQEIFELIRIQGLTHAGAAKLLGISLKTVQRRLNRSLQMLAEKLEDLRPPSDNPEGA